jgi:hypothetical protein
MGQMLNTPVRLPLSGADTFGFAALAGKSTDGNTVQILISNYARPADYKPKPMRTAPELEDPVRPSLWDRWRVAPNAPPFNNRTDIVYHDNGGYNLSIENLPWGKAPFTLKRYRISARQSLDPVEERSASGASLTLSNPLPVDNVELITLQRK